jgi:hypothetical protein
MDNEIILNETNSGSVSSYQFVRVSCFFFSCQSKKSPQSRRGTRMTRIAQIFTDLCVSASTVAPVDVAHTYGSRHKWRSVFHNTLSAFIMPKPCGFSTPRMPAGIRQGLRPLRTLVHVCQCAGIRVHAIDWRDSRSGHALQRRDSGRHHLRLIFVSLSDRTQKAVAMDTIADDAFTAIQSKRSNINT